MSLLIQSPAEMEALGGRLAVHCPIGSRIHLEGELGTGKTTLVRGFLRGLGFKGIVKSPTYTLIEPYLIENKRIYHFDLYRLAAPEELESIGLRDYLDGSSRCLVEWPEQAGRLLEGPDLVIAIAMQGDCREVTLSPLTEAGRHCLAGLDEFKEE